MYVPCPHNVETISKALLACLKSFNLDEKVSTITVDNCTTNDAVMDILREKLIPSNLILGGTYLHMRCCAHILNLVVNDGLDVINSAIEKVCGVVAYCTSTPKRYEKFEDACNYIKVSITRKLSLDCKTRWNSCFYMLQLAISYKEAFYRLATKVPKRRKDKFELPSKEEWKMASEICDKLALFARTSKAFSGRNYPTANIYFQKVCEIRLALRKWMICGNQVIEAMSLKMSHKFDKYWNVISMMSYVASVLDPRRKLECVVFYFKLLYGEEDGKKECERVKQFLIDLVHDYGRNENDLYDVSPSSIPNAYGKRPLVDLDDVENLWERHEESQPLTQPKQGEVETYFEEARIRKDDKKFSLLTWWNIESGKYPTLSEIIAKDLLAVPLSTVASESAFSTGGRVASPNRSRLHPDTIEALMCLQSWRQAQFKDETKGDVLDLGCATIHEDEDVDLE